MDKKPGDVRQSAPLLDVEAMRALCEGLPRLVADKLAALDGVNRDYGAADDALFWQTRHAVADGRLTLDDAVKSVILDARQNLRFRQAMAISATLQASARSTPPEDAGGTGGPDEAAWEPVIDMDTNKVKWYSKNLDDEFQRLRFSGVGDPPRVGPPLVQDKTPAR